MSDVNCGAADNEHTYPHLRIASVFIILATSLFGTLFPIVAKRAWHIPASGFDFVKYFGSGVIIATAFIHLLAPAFDELGSECLGAPWNEYDFAPAFAMISVFGIFFVEIFAFRWGAQMLKKTGLNYDIHAGGRPHTHPEGLHGSHHEGHLEGRDVVQGKLDTAHDFDVAVDEKSAVLAQLVGVAVLEFGVIFHSVIIGLTLAVDADFKTLFIVIIFHQMFEGLGLGSRLAFLSLPQGYEWVPYVGGISYACMTPIGVAIGLGVRTTYNPESATASIVTGTLDAISAGILLYTGLVELLAHDFLFNKEMRNASTGRIAYAGGCMLFGAGIMALLGRWA